MEIHKFALALAPFGFHRLAHSLAMGVAAGPGDVAWANLETVPRVFGLHHARISAALLTNPHGLVQLAALTGMSPLLAINLEKHSKTTGELMTKARSALGLSLLAADLPTARPVEGRIRLERLRISYPVAAEVVDEMLHGFPFCNSVERPVRRALLTTLVCANDRFLSKMSPRPRLLSMRKAMAADSPLEALLRTGAPKTAAAIDGLERTASRHNVGPPLSVGL